MMNSLSSNIDTSTLLDARKSRHLKVSDMKDAYSEEELEEMLKNGRGPYTATSDIKYAIELERQKVVSHTWTLVEDEFIRKNYQHLSDNTIGMALNVPGRMVKYRRKCLGLSKGLVKTLHKVIVWCKREDFDWACNNYELTKTRGDGVLI